jgi:hypothetical protein
VVHYSLYWHFAASGNAQTGAVCMVLIGMERSGTSRQRSEKSYPSLRDRFNNLITHVFAGAGFPAHVVVEVSG